MDEVYYFLVLGVSILSIAVIFGYKPLTAWWDQKLTDRKRRRAHEGKVGCEYKDCDKISVALTPNGYFCEWHWEPMSKKRLENGGSVTWNHVLYHHVKRS